LNIADTAKASEYMKFQSVDELVGLCTKDCNLVAFYIFKGLSWSTHFGFSFARLTKIVAKKLPVVDERVMWFLSVGNLLVLDKIKKNDWD
jgi:hypothetical protein